MPDGCPASILHLRAGGTSVVVDARGESLPRIVHWGADLGDLAPDLLASLVDAQAPQRVSGSTDQTPSASLLPEQSSGWLGTPGLTGHRHGAAFSTALRTTAVRTTAVRTTAVRTTGSPDAPGIVVEAIDPAAELAVTLELEVTAAGLVRQRATVRNLGAQTFELTGVLATFPVPDAATELLDLTGRHLRERSPQRQRWDVGTHLREGRRGRPGADSSLLLVAGEEGFGARSGRVWGVHLAWSGNQRLLAERTISGVSFLAAGELLLAGEILLAPDERYESPWVFGSHGDGLDELATRFHEHLRARPEHPRGPRPVTLNVWEAVYFDHDLTRLTALAEAAATVGVERFVLDDGWFSHRRDDSAGLGDWYVDADVWPDGLAPLITRVRGLGMEFGLWVEPEMVNPDSDLARAHPDWILQTGGRTPPSARNQQVLDLGRPEAYDHILERLDALLAENDIAYLKWDHNRDLIDAGHGPRGVAGVHGQTAALYALLAELRRRHPDVEIESCASGGARVDLGILQFTQRVWASDCIDPLERDQIQRWTELLVPPEMIGAHIGSPVSHTTGRTHALDFRAAAAFFGHLGIEWDLTTATGDELARLAEWVAAHRAHRALLHSGVVVHADQPDPALRLHGVVAPDGGEAIYALTQRETSVCYPTGSVTLPGLAADATYEVRPLAPGDQIVGTGQSALPWWGTGVRSTGRALAVVGLRAPVLFPERSVLLHARRIDPGAELR
ncbi:alpha-galactosidase [Pengzhenrongella frigida]|uniref:Alpha-galactosidase n=1 Tax=Pengzhenrongella frigida TaxID=1259133 RepID=A0A4Q5MX03_9MICO|nr:alpha-galactosidase [Cellulomonas sp. HLT2-17]RYV50129.1 alpha-galactosidase [Cellulomonas sp. HLT2-17]